MAGYPDGIVYLEASDDGTIDMEDLHNKLAEFGSELCGGNDYQPQHLRIFEKNFQQISKAVHEAGWSGLHGRSQYECDRGHVDLKTLGVDAVHNNLHKTWTIPMEGAGPEMPLLRFLIN